MIVLYLILKSTLENPCDGHNNDKFLELESSFIIIIFTGS